MDQVVPLLLLLLTPHCHPLVQSSWNQVLRLLETFRVVDVEAGIQSALERGNIGFDAVKHLVLCRIERRPPRLDMTVYPYLPKAHVAITSPSDYMAFLSGGWS